METTAPYSSHSKFYPRFKPTPGKNKEIWKTCLALPPKYEVSSHGRIRIVTHGEVKTIPIYQNGQHLFVDLWVDNLDKQTFMLAELVLFTHRKDFCFGSRIKFKDGNPRNVDMDNMKFKVAMVPIVETGPEISLWKCVSKAQTANERYKDRTRERITSAEIMDRLKSQHFMCFYCGSDLKREDWQLDHYEPVSKGGHNNHKNIVASCSGCNSIKSDMTAMEFIHLIDRLYMTLVHHPKHEE